MRRNDAVAGMARARGFTLLEVLIALAVLAIALAAVIDKTIESGANIGYLRDRTLAHWVAENKLAEMQALEEWREGEQSGRTELAGRDWHWQVEAQATPVRNLRRVVVRVSDRSGAGSPLAVLHGFLLDPQVRAPAAARQPAQDGSGSGSLRRPDSPGEAPVR